MQQRQDARFAVQVVACVANVCDNLLALHHRLPARRQRRFFVRLDREAGELIVRVGGIIRLCFRRRHPARARPRALARSRAGRTGPLGRRRQRLESAVGVDQGAMGRRVGQRPLVVLAMDLDQRRGQRPQRLGADALVVDVGPRAPVGELNPAQDRFIADLDVLTFERGRARRGLAGRSNTAVT